MGEMNEYTEEEYRALLKLYGVNQSAAVKGLNPAERFEMIRWLAEHTQAHYDIHRQFPDLSPQRRITVN
jgi:hypothetical protein